MSVGALNKFLEVLSMCNGNGNGFCGNFWWIIIIALLLCCCGNGNGGMTCGCERTCC